MKRLHSIALCCILLFFTGCVHCSRNATMFNGKTHGFNPYGTGDIHVVRESYWGNLQCVLKLIEQRIETLGGEINE